MEESALIDVSSDQLLKNGNMGPLPIHLQGTVSVW